MKGIEIGTLSAAIAGVTTTLSAVAILTPAAVCQTPLTTQAVITGLDKPVFVCSPPADSARLFIVEKAGLIRIFKNNALLASPFLDIRSRVYSVGSEQGLLGMAFHPLYEDNGYFYVNYTGTGGVTHISRFQVSADSDVADSGSESPVLTIPQPYSNHNAGMLAFGPDDGYLYIGTGDGGSGGDPGNRAQDPAELLGKMLRLDIDAGSPYSVPADNPFVGTVDTLPEIWALGLRNPWRYAFDRHTGDLYIADVGQNELEEVNFQPASLAGGENYGWRLKEGTQCYNPPTACDPESVLTDPIYEYTHGGSPFRCSITGGYVYRGCAVPDLLGTYFFADYCSGQVWSFRFDGDNLSTFDDRTAELDLPSGINIVSFGEDAYGEIYIVEYGAGTIYKIIPDGVQSQCSDVCCLGSRGNANGDSDDEVNILDLTFIITYLYGGGQPSPCPGEADVNADGVVNVVDLTYVVAYLFEGGPLPMPCP